MGYPSKCTVLALLCFSLFLACKKQEPEKAETVVIPEAVDLGLSVKWASFDVGATQPGEIGKYYSWGKSSPGSRITTGRTTSGAKAVTRS